MRFGAAPFWPAEWIRPPGHWFPSHDGLRRLNRWAVGSAGSSGFANGLEAQMKRALLAAGSALLGLMIGTSALAAAPEAEGTKGKSCISAQDWATVVRDKSTGVTIKVLANIEGMEAKQVVERVNAEPPRTHMSADHVIVLGAKVLETGQPASYVLVAFFNEGCLVASGRADPKGAADLLEGEST
jgi:hypothetical protein